LRRCRGEARRCGCEAQRCCGGDAAALRCRGGPRYSYR
jgi:hypothetical protein